MVAWATIITTNLLARQSLTETRLLKRILTALVLIPVVLLLLLRAPLPVLAIVAALVALLATQEFLALTQRYSMHPFTKTTLAFVALFFVLLAINPGGEKPLLAAAFFVYTLGLAAALAPFLFLTLGMRHADLGSVFPGAAASVFAFTYIALPLGMVVQLRQQWAGAFLVVYLMFVVWSGDIFAYFVGKAMGRHLMAPRVSPKKTWEGSIASLLASMIVGALLYNYAFPISEFLLRHHLLTDQRDGFFIQKPPLIPTLILSAVLNIAAQLGDLVESVLKRGAGVKDSGSILPGHGGMLDRIDALLFAAPLLWYYAAWRVMQ